MDSHTFLFIIFLIGLLFSLYILSVVRKTRKSNAEFKRMKELTKVYIDMLDKCQTVLDTIDPELKYKTYMLKYKSYDNKPQENGYEQFVDEFEIKLFQTKMKLKR